VLKPCRFPSCAFCVEHSLGHRAAAVVLRVSPRWLKGRSTTNLQGLAFKDVNAAHQREEILRRSGIECSVWADWSSLPQL
jgi:hypothetical protein